MRASAPLPAAPDESLQLQTLHGYEADRLVDVVFVKTAALIGRDISDLPGAERTMLGVLFLPRQRPAQGRFAFSILAARAGFTTSPPSG
jgi:hypothetical protein